MSDDILETLKCGRPEYNEETRNYETVITKNERLAIKEITRLRGEVEALSHAIDDANKSRGLALDEVERLRAELAALRENSLAILTRVRGYRDKVITERDALRGLLREARDTLQPISALVDITPGGFPDHDICPIRLGAARELRELHARIDAAIGVEDE